MDNTENIYPKYFKSVDPDGNVIALVTKEAEDAFIIIYPVKLQPEANAVFDVKQVQTFPDVKAAVGGDIIPAEDDDYALALEAWGYDGEDDLINKYTAQDGEKNLADEKKQNPVEDAGTQTEPETILGEGIGGADTDDGSAGKTGDAESTADNAGADANADATDTDKNGVSADAADGNDGSGNGGNTEPEEKPAPASEGRDVNYETALENPDTKQNNPNV